MLMGGPRSEVLHIVHADRLLCAVEPNAGLWDGVDQISDTARTLPSVPELLIWADKSLLPTGHYREPIDVRAGSPTGPTVAILR
jgi:hypothetical protein